MNVITQAGGSIANLGVGGLALGIMIFIVVSVLIVIARNK